MPKITYLDSIECQANKKAIKLIKEILSYDSVYYQNGPFSKKRIETKAFFVNGRTGLFLTGFLPKIKKAFPEIEIDYSNKEFLKFDQKPLLPDIEFRDYQIDAINAVLQKQRGVVKAATGCLCGETKIRLNRKKRGYELSIEKLYKRFNCLDKKTYNYSDGETFVRSFNGKGIHLQKITNVVKSGFKKVVKLELNDGKKIIATPDHKFLTNKGWIKLENLDINKHLIMCDSLHPSKTKLKSKKRMSTYIDSLNFHPFAREVLDKRRGTKTKRIENYRFIYEANLNNLSLDKYKFILKYNKEKSNKLKFVNPKKYHIHHIDFNYLNNSIENLQKLTVKEHKKIHKNYKNFSQGIPQFKKIKNIKKAGFVMTYDIQCPTHHNFVANNMVVHNSGKSVIAGGLISCFKNKNILFLCHSISILEQTKTEFEKWNIKCNQIGGKNGMELKEGITLASIQSFSKIPKNKYDIFYDLVVVDECHRIINRKSQYGKVLQNIYAPMKIGFTATLPEKGEKLLSLEGLVGPVISELSIQDGIKKEIFVKPKISFIPVSVKSSIQNIYKYQEVCKAVVECEDRNKLIIEEAIKRVKQGKTCLIAIRDITHGENLMEIVYEKYSKFNNDFYFVQGKIKKDEREKIRLKLENKEIKCVISTSVWKEGINIKSLNCIILGFIGKSNIQVLQFIGRGTRISEGKTTLEVVDLVDCYKYLSQHFCERMAIYLKEGWV